MSNDIFEGVLDFEDTFYKEGYNDGLTDGEHTGMIEGKVFGIEKGYEKALELGKLHGRGLVWMSRSQSKNSENISLDQSILGQVKPDDLTTNSRLQKHIEDLLILTNIDNLKIDNSDSSVAEFDSNLSRAHRKAKVITTIVKEPLSFQGETITGIEETKGLNARS